MAKGTRLESVRGESLRGFKSHSFRQWRRGRRPDGGSHDAPERAPHGAVASGVLPIAGWLVTAVWFFRAPLFSGFSRVHGDRGDTRLVTMLREHWWTVLRGEASWREPGFFHPWRGALGYSDTFLLESVVYVPWRMVGVEPLLAGQLTVIVLSAVGFAGWWLLLGRVGLSDRPWLRLGLTALATFPHQLAQQVLHQQLLAVWWLPWMLVLGHVAWCGGITRRRLLAAAGLGLLTGLVLSSTLYVGWFIVFVTGLVVAVLAVGELASGHIRSLWATVRRQALCELAALGGFVVGLIPFALVYLPVLGDTGTRPYWAIEHYSPRPFDLVNVGGGNLLWGAALRSIAPGGDDRLDDIEVAMALGPLLLVVMTVLWWTMPRRGRSDVMSPTDSGRHRRTLVGAMVLVVGLGVLLPVEWGPFSLWRGVYAVVPGAGALRATGRLWIVVHALTVVAMAIAVSERRLGDPSRGRPVRRWAMLAVVALLALEQIDLADRASLDRASDMALVASASGPPDWCEVMAVRGGDTSWSFIGPSVDAMRIASALGLPTVHGYSGLFPPEYPIRHDARRYDRRFRDYVRGLDLTESVCVFDLDTRKWDDAPFDVG